MIELIAAAYEDGYAVVRIEGESYAIRPPYRQQDKHRLTSSDIERAVTLYGFVPAALEFEGWSSLIAHLKEQLVQARKDAGYSEPDTEKIRGLVQRAPRKIVLQYLQRIQQELIPNREFAAAYGLLDALQHNKAVLSDQDLPSQLLDLKAECQDAQQQEKITPVVLFNSPGMVKKA